MSAYETCKCMYCNNVWLCIKLTMTGQCCLTPYILYSNQSILSVVPSKGPMLSHPKQVRHVKAMYVKYNYVCSYLRFHDLLIAKEVVLCLVDFIR